MGRISGRSAIEQQLPSHPVDPNARPLNQRLFGYSVDDVMRYWLLFKRVPGGIESERVSLKLDLMFPFAYGAAMAASLLLSAHWLGKDLPPYFMLVFLAVGLLADWVENVTLLDQLDRFNSEPPLELQTLWIMTASVATTSKLVCVAGIIPAAILWQTVHLILRVPRASPM